MSFFINSIIRGIIPNGLIFNKNYETNKICCIDGQQRLTSLIRFRNNDIPVEIDSKINNDYTGQSICRIMKPQEKARFESRNIPVTEYANLSYEDQIDIFNRIQNGMALKKGEIIASIFTTEDFSKIFMKFCDDNYYLVAKFTKKNRKEHVRYITHIFCTINNDKKKILENKQETEIIKKLDNYLTNTKNIMEVLFDDRLLSHIDFKNQINQNILLTFVIFIRDKHKIIDLNDNHYAYLRYAFRMTIIECDNKNIGTKKNSTIITDIFKKIYLDKKILKEELKNIQNEEHDTE